MGNILMMRIFGISMISDIY